MKSKGQLAPLVMTFVGIAVAVIVVAQLALPQAYNPKAPVPTEVTNSTALTGLNATEFKNQNFGLTNIDNTVPSSLKVTFQGKTQIINVTVNGVSIGNLTTSPTTLAVPKTITLTATTIVNYTYVKSDADNNCTNITSSVLTYSQKGAYYGWDSGPQALWLVIPLALVALLLIFIFSGGKR